MPSTRLSSSQAADFCTAVRMDYSTLSLNYKDTVQISQGKTRNFQCINAGFIKHTPLQMEDFAVTCPLVPSVPHLRSGSCTSSRIFGLGFLQTPPHDDALALLLSFGSANTWCEDLHLTSYVPCLAHTYRVTGAVMMRPVNAVVRCSLRFCKLQKGNVVPIVRLLKSIDVSAPIFAWN